MSAPTDDAGEPLAVLSNDDLRRFADEHRVPVDPLRIISGGLMGAVALVFAVAAVAAVVSSIVWFSGVTIMLTSWLAAAMSSALAWGFGKAAWDWSHSRSPIEPTLTPAEAREARAAFNAQRVPQQLMRPTTTTVPPASTTTMQPAKRRP